MDINVLFFELALSFYFVSTVSSIIWLFKGRKATSKLIIAATAIGFLLHTSSIAARYIKGGHFPVTNMHEAASFFAWCLVLLFLYHEVRFKLGLLSSFIMPIVFSLILVSSFFPRELQELRPVLRSNWFGIHVILAFMAYSAFAMACGIGFMYLIQEKYLKSRRLGGLFQRLPSLQVLDEINYHLITLGFSLLTLAIVTGAVWAHSAWGSFWRWDPKEIWSLISWLVYILILHLRLRVGWRGKKTAMLSVTGFATVIFTFFGVNL
ncbi:MAG TPA: c-type cytochrome biogenesis protein CcsB, partial [Nitrospirae bacterium]|nr:c-type cytochrome biogenesis protein CcsB [Nitrospirota bacterium]